MYDLKIKSGGVWRSADLSTDLSIATTFEEAGIAEMAMKGNGTQSVTLPPTPTNCTIFGHLNTRTSRSAIPYTRLDARLYMDGIEIFGAGSYAVLLSTSHAGFEVSIVGGSFDLFTALQNVVFEETPSVLGTTRKWSLNYQKKEDQDGVYHAYTNDAPFRYEMPNVPLSLIKTRLETATGFMLPSNLFRSDRYLSLCTRNRSTSVDDYVAVDSLSKVPDTLDRNHLIDGLFLGYSYKGEVCKEINAACLHVRIVCQYNSTSYNAAVFRFAYHVGDSASTYLAKTLTYTLTGTCSANGFVRGVDATAGDVWYKDIYYWSDGRVTDANGSSVSRATNEYTSADEINDSTFIGWGTYNFVDSAMVSPSWPTGCHYCLLQPMVKYNNTDATYYGEMNIAENIGYKNALELYKALSQLYGIITHPQGKTAFAYKMSDVVAAKASAQDWSAYVIASKDKYAADGYGQTTKYKLKDDEVTGQHVEKAIESDDETLPVLVSNEIAITSGVSHWAKVSKNDDGVYEYEWLKLAAPNLSYVQRLGSDSYLVAIDASDMAEYNTIETMLSRWLFVEAEMLLPASVVLSFDHRKPVFLQQYGAYFYVQKISNWMDGKTCTVELIRL